jgi:hypothetical protein
MSLLGLAAFAAELWAFIDAVCRPGRAFLAAGKATKPLWLALTGVAALVGFGSAAPFAGSPLGGIAAIAAIVVALVYLVDVRPAVRGPRGPRRAGPPTGQTGGW